VGLVEPAGQKYPGLQAPLHTLPRAVLLLHFPAGQSVHDPAAEGLYLPAGHMTAVALVDPAGQA
jgi:hypothetical protein